MFSFKKFSNTKNTRVYLDYAGAAPLSETSKKALIESISMYGNSSGIHKEGRDAGLLLDKARALCAKVLNAHAYEIYFVGSGTESCNLAVLGTYLGFVKSQGRKVEGKSIPHIITSSIEHPSVLEPIKELEKQGKISVTYLPVYLDGIVKVSDVRNALTEQTILVSVMYANNEIGTLQPVKEIGRLIEEWKKENDRTHTAYPYFHTDACQAANYCNLDVVRLRAHLMTINSSKVYGPKGIALLYKREGIHLEPTVYGGGQQRNLRSGTEDVVSAYAFAVALTEARELQADESVRVRALRDYCKSELQKVVPSVVFYGVFDIYDTHGARGGDSRLKSEQRLPNNINCRIPGISSEEMIIRLDAMGFAVSHKSACASQETNGSYVIMALGATEQDALQNIRITFGRMTTQKNIRDLVQAMQTVAEKYSINN